ncbi:MAG: hypothetical protein LBR64_08515 [Dysgonamonadaceae bacterium]|nr:hypothetical protein [Dysgonamonadaceae bacterium]
MGKIIYLVITFIALNVFYTADSQVTIGSMDLPKATLDVKGKAGDATVADGVIPPRLTGDQLKAKDDVYTDDHKGVIVYVTEPVTAAGSKTANVTSAGFYYYDGAVWQALKGLSGGGGTTVSYAADEYSLTLSGTTFAIKESGVASEKIAGNAVTSAKIADNAVITAKIADKAVTTAKLDTLSVTTGKIADNAVTVAQLPAGAANDKFLRGDGTWQAATTYSADESTLTLSGTTFSIKASGVGTDKIADNAVTTAKIADKSVTTAKLDTLSVTTAKIADNAVTVAQLPAGAANDKFLRGDGTWQTISTSSSPTALNISENEITDDYYAQPTDDILLFNYTEAGKTVYLPTTGVQVGKIIYYSNKGTKNTYISPAIRCQSHQTMNAGETGMFMYLGGTGDGSWDIISGY